MVYVALLRGINVGGKGMVPMARLKAIFEALGLKDVQTYINSGNVIFKSPQSNSSALTKRIEAAIKKDVGLTVRVLLRDLPQMKYLVAGIPRSWVNDGQMKCDVMFLWDEVDRPAVLRDLPVNREIEDVKYVKGAVLWRIDRKLASKSRMTRIVGSDLHKNMTIRNPNTVRKLYELMQALDAAA
jgi:uncharacterized protein (DUF1697 family)